MQQVKDPQFMTQYGHSIPVFRKTGILSLSAADGSAAPAYEKGVGVNAITPFACYRVVLCKETELHNQEMTSAYHPLSQFFKNQIAAQPLSEPGQVFRKQQKSQGFSCMPQSLGVRPRMPETVFTGVII